MGSAAEAAAAKDSENAEAASDGADRWRHEVAARLNHYQARRKPRPPRYPSLQLRFEEGTRSGASAVCRDAAEIPQTVVTASHQALALDSFAGNAVRAAEAAPGPMDWPQDRAEREGESFPANTPYFSSQIAAGTAHITAKIIEFPRSWTPPPAPPDELAEPMLNRPRILEAPELLPPPPALGGIAIDPIPQPALERRPGIDIPLQSASLPRRILSAILDDAIIVVACAIFGLIFWKITRFRPPGLQIIEIAIGLSVALWSAYQYLLLIYAGTTPGLRLAGLELARFDGSHASRRLRRWRVLASFLSAFSLGMGYAWVFLDEDSLCWHDRITHTYIAPRKPRIPGDVPPA